MLLMNFYITNPVISTTCYRQRAIWQLNSYSSFNKYKNISKHSNKIMILR